MDCHYTLLTHVSLNKEGSLNVMKNSRMAAVCVQYVSNP